MAATEAAGRLDDVALLAVALADDADEAGDPDDAAWVVALLASAWLADTVVSVAVAPPPHAASSPATPATPSVALARDRNRRRLMDAVTVAPSL